MRYLYTVWKYVSVIGLIKTEWPISRSISRISGQREITERTGKKDAEEVE